MSRISQIIEALEAERADAKTRLAWIEQQIEEFRRHQPAGDSATARRDARAARSAKPQRAARETSSSTKRKPPARTAVATGSPTSPHAANDTAAGKRRNGRGDMRSQILEYLVTHPNSTAGDVAKNLGLKPNSTSTRLSQMAKEGVVEKVERGYARK